MRNKLLQLVLPAILLMLFATSLYLGREHLTRLSAPSLFNGSKGSQEAPKKTSEAPVETPGETLVEPPVEVVANGTILSAVTIAKYLDTILDRKATDLPHLECPALNATRYESLKPTEKSTDQISYFFALNLRQNLALLPRLMGSVVEAIRFLGPQHCALSIVEGNSPDGTADVLAALRPGLDAIGTTYFFQSSSINPSKGDRIAKLAELRNEALQPLLDRPDRASKDTTVLFLNDVSACPEDILELALQRRGLGADMTCAMDWTYAGKDPTFYDVWIARGINGDSFFDIPADGNWNSAWNLFWNAPETQSRFSARRPFQAFSCWNGAAAFGAGPLLGEEKLRFRSANSKAGECAQGEPQLFCKDLWFRGHGKIAVIPTVNLEYSDEKGKMIKKAKGFTSDLVNKQDAAGDKIEWRQDPPERVKCMPAWSNQYWQAWNETLQK